MNARPRIAFHLLLTTLILSVFAPVAQAYYSPSTGRFMSRDPIGYAAGTMNTYEYVFSSPTIHTDPFGLQPPDRVGDPSRRFEDIWHSIAGCIPDMSRAIKGWDGEGPNRRLVDKIDHSINDGRGLISNEMLMCLFVLESDLDPDARSGAPAIGLGQMTKIACDEVDRVLKRPPGTCWADQTAAPGFQDQICNQINNTSTFLAIVIAKQADGNVRNALRRYGPKDAPYAEYADPILECEKCLKGKPKCRGQVYPGADDRSDCFDKARQARRDARSRRR